MKKRGFLVWLGMIALTSFVNAAAWESAAFCDLYVKNIYPLWVNTYARIMGVVPFSVGEWMLIAGVIMTAAALLLALFGLILLGVKRYRLSKKERMDRGNSVCRKSLDFCKKYLTAYAWVVAGVFVVMTLNCFIPYHCSTIEDKYGIVSQANMDEELLTEFVTKKYTLDELGQLRDYVVIKANELAKEVPRDAYGNIIYPDNMEELAMECMLSLSEDYEQLAGYYPQPKQFAFSGFFSQQKIKGYFFPFSLEVNYNSLMHEINRPATICHEYAHLKGFMYEDEANLIGYLACTNSSDPVFRYSGYLSILNYVNNEFYDAVGRNQEVYHSHVRISPQVREENVFLEDKTWEKVEKNAVIKTEVVDKVSDKLSDASMVLNGVEDGILSYTRVVGLLLSYYDGSTEIQETLYGPEYLAQSEVSIADN